MVRHWVLMKGMKQDQRHWVDLPQRLADAFGGRVLCLDLPGAGTEVERPAPATVAALAADVHGRWEAARGDDGPWGVMAFSLGGMVALQWAATWPDGLGAVVVGNTSAGDASPPWRRITPPALVRMARAASTRDPVAREHAVLGLISARQTDARRAELARRYADLQAERPLSGATLLAQLRAGAGFRAPRHLDVPLLVLTGGGDRFVDPRCGAALARRYGAPRAHHPDAGHDLGLDAPAWVVAAARAWCDGEDPTSVVSGG
ncbi:MAG: alpha/beta fold hydrolase [Alphaproteobacteria bacterium]|nr:alpha/beta fold hydrolase [Alphaproteobacteria bacterium]